MPQLNFIYLLSNFLIVTIKSIHLQNGSSFYILIYSKTNGGLDT